MASYPACQAHGTSHCDECWRQEREPPIAVLGLSANFLKGLCFTDSVHTLEMHILKQSQLHERSLILQAMTIGLETFPFTAHNTILQDVVRVPESGRGGPCHEVAQIQQRLHLQVSTGGLLKDMQVKCA